MLPILSSALSLTKIAAPKASLLTSAFQPQAQAQALLQPDHTPAQFMSALEQKNLSTDQINVLAHGMPERESVHWACQSSRQVEGQLVPADKQALEAAEKWVQNPSEATKADAATAASKTDFKGPGAWAAQGAGWSKSMAGTAPAAGPTGSAVSGSVHMSAAMASKAIPASAAPAAPVLPSAPAQPTLPTAKATAPPSPTVPEPPPGEIPPNVLEQQAKMHKPFIDLGKTIADGKNTWAQPAPAMSA
jgi:hypothetical protein